MDAALHPVKTAAGQSELSTRARRLSQRHRTVLLLVDGKRSEGDVRAMASRAGVPESCFAELVALGLIGLPLAVPRPATAPIQPLSTAAALLAATHLLPPAPDTTNADLDSLLPPSRTLSPESISADSRFDDRSMDSAWRFSLSADDDSNDAVVAEVREILIRAVRSAAPVAGSLTLLRLRRARTRRELTGLLGEVAQRIARPPRALAGAHTLRRVRDLLDGRLASPATP